MTAEAEMLEQLRDMFACEAMGALVPHMCTSSNMDLAALARKCYHIADVMMCARSGRCYEDTATRPGV